MSESDDKLNELIKLCITFNDDVYQYYVKLSASDKNKCIWDYINQYTKELIYKSKSFEHLVYLICNSKELMFVSSNNQNYFKGYKNNNLIYLGTIINNLFAWNSLSLLITYNFPHIGNQDDIEEMIRKYDYEFSGYDDEILSKYLDYLNSKFNSIKINKSKKTIKQKIKNIKI